MKQNQIRQHANFFAATAILGICIATAKGHPGPGIVVDSKETVYFVDFTHDRIMKVGADGKVSVFVDGAPGERFTTPHHLTIDARDNIFTASDRGGCKIWRFKPDGTGEQVYPPPAWYGVEFIGAGGNPFTVDDKGNIYGINSRQDRASQIIRIDGRGMITVLAGDKLGNADGRGVEARFSEMESADMVCSPTAAGASSGVLFVGDGSAIRKVMPDGTVSTFVGGPESGLKDGVGKDARFAFITGLNWDRQGNLIVADHPNGCVRKVTPDGRVTTLLMKRPAKKDGDKGDPPPIVPVGAAAGPSADVYVLDYPSGDDPRVCRVKADGAATVIANLGKPER